MSISENFKPHTHWFSHFILLFRFHIYLRGYQFNYLWYFAPSTFFFFLPFCGFSAFSWNLRFFLKCDKNKITDKFISLLIFLFNLKIMLLKYFDVSLPRFSYKICIVKNVLKKRDKTGLQTFHVTINILEIKTEM